MAVDRRTIARATISTAVASTALSEQLAPVNLARSGFSIQNHGTNPAFIALGRIASVNTYDIVLQGGTATLDGKGGVYSQVGGSVFAGIITSSATGATITFVEY